MKKFVRKNRLTITIIISLIVLGVFCVTSYIIYAYGFYNSLQDNKVVEYYNTYNFSNLYDYMNRRDDHLLSKKTFILITDMMYNKLNLQRIYESYYADGTMYTDMDNFVSEYYYGYGAVKKSDIDFIYTGKTTLFKRRKVTVEGINIISASGVKSYLGIISNVTFNVDNNSTIRVDGQEIKCENNKCIAEKMFGGVHLIEYTNGDFTYLSIYNIYNNNTVINVGNLNNLVPVSKKISIEDDNFDKLFNEEQTGIVLKAGLYALKECKNKDVCPNNNSYMTLSSDGTIIYSRYINDGVDTYLGEYSIYNGHLNIIFKKINDRNIEEKVTFKIVSETSFSNDNYVFGIKA